MDDLEMPAYLRKQCNEGYRGADPAGPKLADRFSLTQLLAKFNDLSLTFTDFEAGCTSLSRDFWTGEVRAAVSKLAGESDSFGAAWACLIEWITEQTGIALARHAQRLLNSELGKVDATLRSLARNEFSAVFHVIGPTISGEERVQHKTTLLQKVKRYLGWS